MGEMFEYVPHDNGNSIAPTQALTEFVEFVHGQIDIANSDSAYENGLRAETTNTIGWQWHSFLPNFSETMFAKMIPFDSTKGAAIDARFVANNERSRIEVSMMPFRPEGDMLMPAGDNFLFVQHLDPSTGQESELLSVERDDGEHELYDEGAIYDLLDALHGNNDSGYQDLIGEVPVSELFVRSTQLLSTAQQYTEERVQKRFPNHKKTLENIALANCFSLETTVYNRTFLEGEASQTSVKLQRGYGETNQRTGDVYLREFIQQMLVSHDKDGQMIDASMTGSVTERQEVLSGTIAIPNSQLVIPEVGKRAPTSDEVAFFKSLIADPLDERYLFL